MSSLSSPAMSAQASSVRPVFQQFVTAGSGRSRLVSSPRLRAAPLATHDSSPLHDPFAPIEVSTTTSTQLTTAVQPLLAKAHRRTNSRLRQPLGTLPLSSSPRLIPAADIPPTPRTPAPPIFAALSDAEDPRSTWPRIELQRAAMVRS